MYPVKFTEKQMQQWLDQFLDYLLEEGWLCGQACERGMELAKGFLAQQAEAQADAEAAKWG
jgi:hypothetical protein